MTNPILDYLKRVNWWEGIKWIIESLADFITKNSGGLISGWTAQLLAATILVTIFLGIVAAVKQIIKVIVVLMWLFVIIAIIASLIPL
ncbi:MAG: hypothetical protein ACTSXJ_05840 [Candidatus Baldrarchaeia archaeon]